MVVAKHYGGSKSLWQGLWNTLFSWAQIANYYYAEVILVRQGPLGSDRTEEKSVKISGETRDTCSQKTNQRPWDHPDIRKNALGVKRPFSEPWERSGVLSEQLWDFRK